MSEAADPIMKYTIFEDPVTHRFGYLPLSSRFADGDRLPPIVIERWFESHQAAVAGLSELLSADEVEPPPAEEAAVQTSAAPPSIDRPHRPLRSPH